MFTRLLLREDKYAEEMYKEEWVYYASGVPYEESYDGYVKCVDQSVVVISIKSDRNTFICRRVAPVPTRVVLSARVSPLRRRVW